MVAAGARRARASSVAPRAGRVDTPWGYDRWRCGTTADPMANALTAARVLLAVPFAFLMFSAGAWSAVLAGLVLAAAIATDLLDGRLARRRGTATAGGGVFDHATDCLFVAAGLGAGALRGAFPWVLPVLVAAAFTQYVLDSFWGHGALALRASALGRWNGVLYFVPLVGDVLARLGLPVGSLVTVIAWALCASTVISMGDRLWALARALRTARGSPAGGTADRRRR
jgi:CDP-diacylglycerol--glycerol-3-phosphate 3-phosphatidyltransferase